MSIVAIRKPVSTSEKLIEMLKENTGCHMLDSGGVYGRNWQQNQEVDFPKRPVGTIEFSEYTGELDICAILNVYHWLLARVDYNPELDEKYQEYVEREDLYLDLDSMESFVETLDNAAGIYGDGKPFTTTNTYNGKCLLSQILQYVYWSDEQGSHVLLQIHGGCDARGGYTYPVAFDLVDETCIFDNARGTIYCNDCDAYWDTDDGYNWYTNGEYTDNLKDYLAVDKKPVYPEKPDLNQATLPIDLPDRPIVDSGVVWVDKDRNGHCSFCGGLLGIDSYPC